MSAGLTSTARMRPAGVGQIVWNHQDLEALIRADARIEHLAGGFLFTEGPLWRAPGELWFSDIVGNVIRRWRSDGQVEELMRPAGYDGDSLPAGGFNGPNGMTSGPNSTVTLCQHGNRRVVSVDSELRVATLVERFEGKRLNSPNDVVYRADGGLYFSDPPYGLPQGDQDPEKDLRFNGVFRYADGTLDLLTALTRPNGLAFSPDHRVLYVANSDESHRCWMRYELAPDGSVAGRAVFRDVSTEPDAGLPDGMKLDATGNIFATGPGGVWVMTPDGAHLGTLTFPEQPANLAWGDDGGTLYVTAETGLYRIKTAVQGQPLVYS